MVVFSLIVVILKQRTQLGCVFSLQIRAPKSQGHPKIVAEVNIHQLKRLFFKQKSIYARNFSFYQKVKRRSSIKHPVTRNT